MARALTVQPKYEGNNQSPAGTDFDGVEIRHRLAGFGKRLQEADALLDTGLDADITPAAIELLTEGIQFAAAGDFIQRALNSHFRFPVHN